MKTDNTKKSNCNILCHRPRIGANAADRQTFEVIERKVHMNDFSWYVPHFTPIFPQQKILLERTAFGTASELE